MDLVDKLIQMVPDFKASCAEKTKPLIIDGIIQGKLHSNLGKVNLWFNFQNHDYGIMFNDERTKITFNTLINKYCYKLLMNSEEDLTYEAIILEGQEPVGIVNAQFFTIGPVQDEFRVKFAKELLQFYQQHYDKNFEDKT